MHSTADLCIEHRQNCSIKIVEPTRSEIWKSLPLQQSACAVQESTAKQAQKESRKEIAFYVESHSSDAIWFEKGHNKINHSIAEICPEIY